MSRAHSPQANEPIWKETLLHAAVALVLFVALLTGALLYGFFWLRPQLLHQALPDFDFFRSQLLALWFFGSAGAAVLVPAGLVVAAALVGRSRRRPVGWPWVLGGSVVALGLLLQPILCFSFFVLQPPAEATADAQARATPDAQPGAQDKKTHVTYKQEHTEVPDLGNPQMSPALYLWAGAGVVALVVVSVLFFVLGGLRQRLVWPWVVGAAVAVLLLIVPPVVLAFTAPWAPRIPGGLGWWYITGAALAVGLAYVGWMYFRDSRGVGPLWATMLGLVRAAVLTLLAFFFMLPAVQTYSKVYTRSKVLVLLDVSGSITSVSDDLPDANHTVDSLPTRQDKVLAFLADAQKDFLHGLQKTNQLDVYRFARSADPEYLHFSKDNRNWTKTEWETWLKSPDRDQTAPPVGDLPAEFWTTWLKPTSQVQALPTWTEDQKTRFDAFQTHNSEMAADADYLGKTNFIDSLKAVLENEGHKESDVTRTELQGVILISDGHNTPGEPSPDAYENAKKVAQRLRVPIFVVGLGQERPQVRLDITELRVPPQVQPDDKFPAVVELTGEGLSGKPAPVELEVTYSRKGADGKEVLLPLKLVESVEETEHSVVKPTTPAKPPAEWVLPPQPIILRPDKPVQFDTGSPPRAEVSYAIDAVALAAAAGVDLKAAKADVKKWEIGVSEDGAALHFRAHIRADEGERIAAKEHVSDVEDVTVLKKPLRVLLFASAATHEYQFLQAILVRDSSKGRVKVSAYLQPPPGQQQVNPGVIQDASLLDHFPDQFDPNQVGQPRADKPDNPYDLSDYDVIVAFDPDWTQLSKEQIGLLFGRTETGPDGKDKPVPGWVDKGGGFVYVAGPVNTVKLASPEEDQKARLGPILRDLPVVPVDNRLMQGNRGTDKAWPLDFKGASPALLKFLKLKDETADDKFEDDWKEFFGTLQPDRSVDRGFYNFYPVKSVAPAALVAAYFGDPEAKAEDANGQTSLMPYIVVSNPAEQEKRVIWVGWGEMWRLRQKSEAYLEHFWTKLTRYAGDLHHGKIVKRITPNFGKAFKSTDLINMEARIEGRGGESLPEDARPTLKVTLTSSVTAKMTDDDRAALLKLQERAGVSPDQLRRRAELERRVKDKKPLSEAEAKELQGIVTLQRANDLTAVEKQQMADLGAKAREDARQTKALEDLKKPLEMKPKPQSDGWYQAQFKAPVAGDYTMELTVSETGDTLTHHFKVNPSNPEVDDARPDYDRLYEAASYADQYLPTRMDPGDYADLVRSLEGDRPKLEESTPDSRPRLYFTLENAHLIPGCMINKDSDEPVADQDRYIWGETVAAPTPVQDQWVPWWAALPLGVGLLMGCVVCSSLAGRQSWIMLLSLVGALTLGICLFDYCRHFNEMSLGAQTVELTVTVAALLPVALAVFVWFVSPDSRQWKGPEESARHPWAAMLTNLLAATACFGVFAFFLWGLNLYLPLAVVLFFAVGLGGYFFARYANLAAWCVCVLAVVVLVPPVFLPPAFALGWYAFAGFIGLMCLEWTVRKVLRLA